VLKVAMDADVKVPVAKPKSVMSAIFTDETIGPFHGSKKNDHKFLKISDILRNH
jgi:hypothetical protein